MKYSTIILLLLLSFEANAQKHLIGIKGGMGATNVYSVNHLMYNAQGMFGTLIGVNYEYLFHKNFSFGADLYRNTRGYRRPNEFIKFDPTASMLNITGGNDFCYYSLPIYFKIRTGGRFHVFANIGFTTSFLAKSYAKRSEYNLVYDGIFNSDSFEMTRHFNMLDYSALFEGGLGYRFPFNMSMTLNTAYHHGLRNIHNYKPYSDSKITHRAIFQTLSINYIFGRKEEQ